jgi:flagellar assembly factor FliW
MAGLVSAGSSSGGGAATIGNGVPTMRINTSRFGRIDVDDADLLTFPGGLPGLEGCREWALLADATNDALGWLQSTHRPDVALAVVSPRRFVPGYQVRIPRSELLPLSLADLREAQVVVILSHNGARLTLNLKAPIVINLATRTGRQVVASGEQPLQFELGGDRPHMKQSA